MNFIEITDIKLPELHIYHQFREHAFTADESFVADSPKVVNLLLETDITVRSILATQEYYDAYIHLIERHQDAKFYIASKALMQDIVGHKIHHNVMMHGTRPQQSALTDLGRQHHHAR